MSNFPPPSVHWNCTPSTPLNRFVVPSTSKTKATNIIGQVNLSAKWGACANLWRLYWVRCASKKLPIQSDPSEQFTVSFEIAFLPSRKCHLLHWCIHLGRVYDPIQCNGDQYLEPVWAVCMRVSVREAEWRQRIGRQQSRASTPAGFGGGCFPTAETNFVVYQIWSLTNGVGVQQCRNLAAAKTLPSYMLQCSLALYHDAVCGLPCQHEPLSLTSTVRQGGGGFVFLYFLLLLLLLVRSSKNAQ